MGGYRWIRLVPPLWVTVIIYLIICLGVNIDIERTALITYFFNLQGIQNVFRFISLPVFKGLGQTWFVTVIAFCYILMVAFKKAVKIECWIDQHLAISLLVGVALQVGFSYLGIQLSYFLQFFIGYFVTRKTDGKNEWIHMKSFTFVTVFTIILAGLRLYARQTIDGTVLYDMVIARLSFNALAIWLIMLMVKICNLSIIQKMARRKIWRLLDLASYPLFLTHYMFLQGPFRISGVIDSMVLQLLVFIVLTIVSASVVMIITDRKSILKVIYS